MNITKGELKKIILEEVQNISSEKDEFETLVENYANAYAEDADIEYVSKESIIDFLDILDENKIPREALEAFMENLPENLVTDTLNDVLND